MDDHPFFPHLDMDCHLYRLSSSYNCHFSYIVKFLQKALDGIEAPLSKLHQCKVRPQGQGTPKQRPLLKVANECTALNCGSVPPSATPLKTQRPMHFPNHNVLEIQNLCIRCHVPSSIRLKLYQGFYGIGQVYIYNTPIR